MTRYSSQKPEHQKPGKIPGGIKIDTTRQPPLGSEAVFEWERFSRLPDFTDASLLKVFKQISEQIIERPYHYDGHRLVKEDGTILDIRKQNIKGVHTDAKNNAPPEKIDGIAVYKQNHGTGHAIRQMIYTDAMVERIAKDGNPKGQAIAQKIDQNDEIKSILKLAAYCKRIGRTLDNELDNHANDQASIYSRRSSDMFAMIAGELGYNDDLINIIKDSMLEPSPQNGIYQNVSGINGKDLKIFAEDIFMAAHRADLARIFPVRINDVAEELEDYFPVGAAKDVATKLVELSCAANGATGNAVRKQEDGVKHDPKAVLDGKKLVAVVKNIGGTIEELAQLVKVKFNQGVIPFRVDFETTNKQKISAVEQAKTILNEVDKLHKQGAQTVGITYSANQGQTDKILDTYAKKGWNTATSGSNQAEVINEIEKLLATAQYKHLQNVYKTVPITTMKYVGNTAMAADLSSVQKSIDNANQFIADGGVLLGWTNQATKTGNLAIGGGVAAQIQPQEQRQMINQWVKEKLGVPQVIVKPDNKPKVEVQPEANKPKVEVQPEANKPKVDVQPEANKPKVDVQPEVNKPKVDVQPEVNKPKVEVKPESAKPTIKNNYDYKAFSASEGRSHLFSASVSSSVTETFKERYQSSQGDHLKTKILEDLKVKIESIDSKKGLETFAKNITYSPEYEILNKGQGLFTRITGIKTSSVAALEDMIKQKSKSLEQPGADDSPTFKA